VPTIAYSSHGYSVDPVMFPMIPSFIPTPYRGQPQRTGFWDRVWNSLALWNSPFVNGRMYSNFDALAKKHHYNMKGRAVEYAYVDSMVILMCHPALDYQRPMFNNVKCLAGMNDWPHPQLDDETVAFLQSAGEAGVIVISFGSIMNTIEQEKAVMIANAMSRLPQKVIWRHKGDKKELERKNIRLVDWFFQTSLLEHPQIRLFITHCGDHSTIETAIHGVPVIAMPVYLDQFENAIRLTDKAGMGVIVEYGTATEEKVYTAVKDVLKNKTYSDNAKLTSSLIKDRPINSHDEFLYHVDYVIKYKGIPHQTADPVRSLSTVEIYNIDVIIFTFFMLIVAGIVAIIGAVLLCKGALKLKKMQLEKKGI
jgi:glucuronosyltransferase